MSKYYGWVLFKDKGVVNSWEECKELVSGRHAEFKKFGRKEDAEEWVSTKLKEVKI